VNEVNVLRTTEIITSLDSMIERALTSFLRDIHSDPRWRREHELVSLFVFGHLIPKSRGSGVINHLTQIGIGAAVPQLKRLWTRRKKSDVCKDIVIWPEPGMTCWDSEGEPEHFPLSILEWKSLNRHDRGRRLPKRRRDRYAEDLKWLCDMSRWTLRKNLPFVGYRVLVNQKAPQTEVRVDRVSKGNVKLNWWRQ
jgi:hypothetical protein